MPRPKTKIDLLELSQANFDKLFHLVDSVPPEELEDAFPEGYLNRNIKDVLAHLHHWHLLFLHWHETAGCGEKPQMPAEGYTWKTVPELNIQIQKKYSDMKLEEARDLLNTSFQKVRKIIQSHSEDELFEKKRYKWTGSTSLSSYLISATSSHYDWAFKLIKKCRR